MILFWRTPKGEWQSKDIGAGLGDFKEHVTTYDRTNDQLERILRANPNPDGYIQVLQQVTPLLRAAKHLSGVR